MTAKQTINTGKAPQAIGPYSQGIRAGSYIFTAGQIGLENDLIDEALVDFNLHTLVEFVDEPDPIAFIVFVLIAGIIVVGAFRRPRRTGERQRLDTPR